MVEQLWECLANFKGGPAIHWLSFVFKMKVFEVGISCELSSPPMIIGVSGSTSAMQ
jgi:hypothetical protein